MPQEGSSPAEGTLLCGMGLILLGVIAWFAVSAVLSPGAVQAQGTAPGWEAAIALPEPFARSAGTLVQRVTAELLRYRPTLSYGP